MSHASLHGGFALDPVGLAVKTWRRPNLLPESCCLGLERPSLDPSLGSVGVV